MVVFGMITVMGIHLLRGVDLARDSNLMTATLAVLAGVLPIVGPATYQALPPTVAMALGSGVTTAAVVGVLANMVFGRSGKPG